MVPPRTMDNPAVRFYFESLKGLFILCDGSDRAKNANRLLPSDRREKSIRTLCPVVRIEEYVQALTEVCSASPIEHCCGTTDFSILVVDMAYTER